MAFTGGSVGSRTWTSSGWGIELETALVALLSDGFGFLINKWTLAVAAGVFVALRALNGWPMLSEKRFYRRTLPVLPESIGIAVWVLGGLPIGTTAPLHGRAEFMARVMAGLWSAYLAQKFRKILAQTLLGDDARIKLDHKELASLMVPDENEQKED